MARSNPQAATRRPARPRATRAGTRSPGRPTGCRRTAATCTSSPAPTASATPPRIQTIVLVDTTARRAARSATPDGTSSLRPIRSTGRRHRPATRASPATCSSADCVLSGACAAASAASRRSSARRARHRLGRLGRHCYQYEILVTNGAGVRRRSRRPPSRSSQTPPRSRSLGTRQQPPQRLDALARPGRREPASSSS